MEPGSESSLPCADDQDVDLATRGPAGAGHSLPQGQRIAALTLGISEGGAWGWLDLRTVSAIGDGILLAAVLLHRCTVAADPLLGLDLLRHRQFALVTVVTVLYAAALFGTLFTFMLFLTGPWHMTLTAAGWH